MNYDRDSVLSMLDEVNDMVEQQVQGMQRIAASAIGLDDRCGRVYIDRNDQVIATANRSSLDYYGGFEYIKEGEGRITVGDYTFYTTDSERVQACFDRLNEIGTEEVEAD
jgi:hypothetical protein